MIADRLLSQKPERAEARSNAAFIESHNRLDPGFGASWLEIGGTYALFDGVESPMTQTFGLGIFGEATNENLDKIEAFFQERNAHVIHEVSPIADPSILPLLNERGYNPIELSSILYRETDSAVEEHPNREISTRVVSVDEAELWAKTSAAGWTGEHESLSEFMLNFGLISAQCEGAYPFLAEFEGEAISTGMLFVHDDVALLAGASTVPESRNRGAQGALLSARLKFAKENGCTLAVMGAAPGSQSQSNAQKRGFHIAYTRTKWQLV